MFHTSKKTLISLRGRTLEVVRLFNFSSFIKTLGKRLCM